MSGNKNFKNILIIFFVILYIVLLTVIVQHGSAFLASYILILTLISAIIYVLMTKDKRAGVLASGILDSKEMIHVSNLLRYATAVLSFISLMTTAKGLQSFVFSENEAWMAYLASFAVQAILVCFSLAFCHICSAIHSVTTLSDRGKTLATGALTLFLATSFVVSSSFSFSYIANNAYILLGANDSEIIIERYLTQRAMDLGAENKQIGSQLYNSIKEKNQLLTGTIKEYVDQKNGKLKDTVNNFELPKYSLQSENTNYDFGLTNEIIDGWKKTYPARAADIDGLVLGFHECAGDLKKYCDNYDDIRNKFNGEKMPQGDDWSSTESAVQNAIDSLNSLSKNLASLHDQCVDLRIFSINYDIAPYRGKLIQRVETLQNHVEDQIERLNALMEEVASAVNGYSANNAGNSLSDQIQKIQKEIYMLNIMDMTNAAQTSQQNVEAITEQLSNILAAYLNDDILSSDSVSNILQLEELVAEYGACIALEHGIDAYIDTNLSKTYNISGKTKPETSDNPLSGEAAAENVTYEEWISYRNNDFLSFFSLLKKLPDETVLSQNTAAAEITGEEAGPEGLDSSVLKFVAADVLYEANILRRDLLGQTTDFERAFNYFKYDFRGMAFFSAFIAAFFDLGAFLTGCFLYVMRHFKQKKYQKGESNVSEHEQKTEASL